MTPIVSYQPEGAANAPPPVAGPRRSACAHRSPAALLHGPRRALVAQLVVHVPRRLPVAASGAPLAFTPELDRQTLGRNQRAQLLAGRDTSLKPVATGRSDFDLPPLMIPDTIVIP